MGESELDTLKRLNSDKAERLEQYRAQVRKLEADLKQLEGAAKRVCDAYDAHMNAETDSVNALKRDEALAEQAEHMQGLLTEAVCNLGLKMNYTPSSPREGGGQ